VDDEDTSKEVVREDIKTAPRKPMQKKKKIKLSFHDDEEK